MRSHDPETLAYLQSGAGVEAKLLLWARARNRETGTEEAVGFWDGRTDQEIVIDGQPRTYHGAGQIIGIGPIVAEIGLTVRQLRIQLAETEKILQALLGYEMRLAAVEIHRALYHLESGVLVGTPDRRFKGWVDTNTWPVGPVNGAAAPELTLVSAARALTRSLTTKYSDASMQVRGGDRMFRYADISGSVPVAWGTKSYNWAHGGRPSKSGPWFGGKGGD